VAAVVAYEAACEQSQGGAYLEVVLDVVELEVAVPRLTLTLREVLGVDQDTTSRRGPP